ncbi:MAG: trypsin-like peptidase domain-containing protein [Firmicutes bacterium]|nr:trypsin-like peptidase domain-containing protein [Bacillota bacterium]
MAEEKKALDIFGLTDIEKIQAEIERDLGKAEQSEVVGFSYRLENPEEISVSPDTNPFQDTFEPAPDVSASAELSTDTYKPHDSDWLKADAEDDNSAITRGFYRETIKNVHKEKRVASAWLKKAVALFLVITLGMSTLGFGIGAGFGYFNRQNKDSLDISNAEGPVLTSMGYTFENILEGTETGTLADIVEFLKPSVVGITTRVMDGPVEVDVRQGSGLIFAESNDRIFIATVLSLVQGGGNSFEVNIMGGRSVIGRPASSDSRAHLAVLYVEKSQLVAAGIDTIVIATFGDSDQMRIGDTVLAIGNVMGYGNAVTRGVISASEQTVPLGEHVLSLLQTDAAINYGNSGGPLINTRGEVIGLNFDGAASLIFGRTQVEGMGFSISSNIVAPILDDLVNGRRAALGIMGRTITESVAENLGIPAIGVHVSDVLPGRAAYRGGMRGDDIITGFNGMHVFNWNQLVHAIHTAGVGEAVEVRVLRYGTTEITLFIELDVMVVENF